MLESGFALQLLVTRDYVTGRHGAQTFKLQEASRLGVLNVEAKLGTLNVYHKHLAIASHVVQAEVLNCKVLQSR